MTLTPEMQSLREAAGRLIKAKGRFHTEQNYAALVAAYDALEAASVPAQTGTEPAPLPSPDYFKALGIVHAAGFASQAMVQRRMAIGWNEAGFLINQMLQRGDIIESMTSGHFHVEPPSTDMRRSTGYHCSTCLARQGEACAPGCTNTDAP